MKRAILQIVLSILCLSAQAQKVANIRAEQRGQDIVVLYSLETSSPCEVSLLLSQDNGTNWSSPLKNVSGDVGKNISAGEKQITWKVLEEREQLVGDKIKFKVIANGNKSFEPEMVLVEGGTFQMGSNNGESFEKPVHKEFVADFSISKFEITQKQWKEVMKINPSQFPNCDNCPVENVSWQDIQVFIELLNKQTNQKYRLPTEAEWEFAARGGNLSKGYNYSGSNDLNAVGWNDKNSNNIPHPVGMKKPNELGIYDMTGNVFEWCEDIWKEAGYEPKQPSGSSVYSYHILRGGSWYTDAFLSRNTYRGRRAVDYKMGHYGFRLVLPAEYDSKSDIQSESMESENENELVATFIEDPAEFSGGQAALYKFISNNLVYPEDAIENGIEGKVIVKFVVDVDGTVRNVTIERGVAGGQSLEQAAIDVCRKFPKFEPAMQNGKAVKTYYRLPINFQL